MKTFINGVGITIPFIVTLGKAHIYKGKPVLKSWYGRYDLDTSIWTKLKQLKNYG